MLEFHSTWESWALKVLLYVSISDPKTEAHFGF